MGGPVKKKPALTFPEDCCGVCVFYRARDSDDGVCHGNPPASVVQAEALFFVRPLVEPLDRACSLFKPIHHG